VKDDDKPSIEELRNDFGTFIDYFFFESNPTHKNNWYKNMFMEVQDESNKIKRRKGLDYPIFIGVDWAKDSGMNRGDVMSRNDNVIEVRFKTVTINN
jgi:hypothetical protein